MRRGARAPLFVFYIAEKVLVFHWVTTTTTTHNNTTTTNPLFNQMT